MRVLPFLPLACALFAATATGDTLVMPALGQQGPPNRPEGLPRPTRGMDMDRVLQRFGEPAQRLAAVGEPPITRWIYDRYTVYFEGRIVLRAVVTRP